MKVVVEDVRAQIYINGELTEVLVTIEIDTDRLNDAARRAYHSRNGVATWSDRAIRAIIQEWVPEGKG